MATTVDNIPTAMICILEGILVAQWNRGITEVDAILIESYDSHLQMVCEKFRNRLYCITKERATSI